MKKNFRRAFAVIVTLAVLLGIMPQGVVTALDPSEAGPIPKGAILEEIQNFGGSGGDSFNSLIKSVGAGGDFDGYVIVGVTNSSDHDVADSITGYVKSTTDQDAIVVKYNADSNGRPTTVAWKRIIHGAKTDAFQSVIQTTDGGYFAVGKSSSSDGDFSNRHSSGALNDAVLVKFDHTGNTVWVKNIGGSKADEALSVAEASDGGFVLVGDTQSTDGDFTGYNTNTGVVNKMGFVARVDEEKNPDGSYKLNDDGSPIVDTTWMKCMGGSLSPTNTTVFTAVLRDADGSYFIGGYSSAVNGDFTNKNYGGSDGVLLKLSEERNADNSLKRDEKGLVTLDIGWLRNYGGETTDQFTSLAFSSDGNSIVATGPSGSTTHDLASRESSSDILFIIKARKDNGDLVNVGSFGNGCTQSFNIISTHDGGYAVFGASKTTLISSGGTQTGAVSVFDGSLNMTSSIHLDDNEATGQDIEFKAGLQLPDGGYVAIGYADSADGNVGLSNYGGQDALIAKFSNDYDCDGDGVPNDRDYYPGDSSKSMPDTSLFSPSSPAEMTVSSARTVSPFTASVTHNEIDKFTYTPPGGGATALTALNNIRFAVGDACVNTPVALLDHIIGTDYGQPVNVTNTDYSASDTVYQNIQSMMNPYETLVGVFSLSLSKGSAAQNALAADVFVSKSLVGYSANDIQKAKIDAYDTSSGTLTPLDTTINTQTGAAEFVTDRLTTFAVVLHDNDPIVTGVANGAHYNSAVLPLKISCKDSNGGSNVSATLSKGAAPATSISGGCTLTEDGDYTLTVTDNATHVVITDSFVIDTVTPTVSINGEAVAYGSTTFYKTPTITFHDANNVFASYAKNGGNPQSLSSGDSISDEGSYQVKVWDEAGNTTSFTVVVDKTAPAFVITSHPVSVNTYDSSVELQLTESGDNDPGNKITYSLDNGTPKQYSNVDLLFKGQDIGLAAHQLVVSDSAGNTAAFNFTLCDQTAPNPSIHNGNFVKSGYLTFSDWGSGVKSAMLSRDGAAPIDITGFGVSGYPVSDEGVYTLALKDNLDNSTTITFTVDSTPPVIRANGEALTNTGTYFYKTAPHITYSDGDSQPGDNLTITVAKGSESGQSHTISENKYELPDIEDEYSIRIDDQADNRTFAYIIVDKTAPDITGVTDGGAYNASSIPTIRFSDTDKNSLNTLVATLCDRNGTPIDISSFGTTGYQVTKDGDYTLTVTDQAGNAATEHFTVNATLPIVTGVADKAAYNGSNLPTITFDGANSLQASATLNGSPFVSGTQVTEEGSYKLVATDEKGNQSVISFSIDKTPPVITGVKDGDTTQNAVEPSFNEGTATLNEEPFNSGTKVSKAGDYTLVVTDAAGNTTKASFTILSSTITDPSSETSLAFDPSDLPDGVTAITAVESRTVSDAVQRGNIELALKNGGYQLLSASDIVILDQNNQPITGKLSGKVTVKIRIPEGVSDPSKLAVLWYNPADGTTTDMNAKVEGDYLVFETDHFSIYTIAEVVGKPAVKNPKTGDYDDDKKRSAAFAALVALLIASAAFVLASKPKEDS